MALELAPLGIRVMIVEPGPFRTEFLSGSLDVSPAHHRRLCRTSGKARADRGRADLAGQPGDPVKGVRAIIKASRRQIRPFISFLVPWPWSM